MKIKNYIILLFIALFAFSCIEDDAIYVEDHFLDYEIPIVAVDADYVVGAHYSRFTWSNNVEEEPTLGQYDAENGDPQIYAQHVTQAQTGGIDYFLFGLRSTYNLAQFQTDSTYIDTLQMASNAGDLNFGISYNFGSMGLSANNEIDEAGLVPVLLEDFEKMMPFFQMPNYMKVDGKYVVYMPNSRNLWASDNEAVYQQLRAHMSGMGIDLYLIGEQQEWTPPLRYDFRFENGVDAVTHTTYTNLSTNWYDRIYFFHKMCDQAWTYHQETFNAIGLEYIPTLVPSRKDQISSPGSTDWIVPKDADWFAAHCNVARKIAASSKLILIDSFNNWNRDTQLESANSYGDSFLSQLKQEFKVN